MNKIPFPNPRRFSPFSLSVTIFRLSRCANTLLVEDESNFHACVDARVLKSRNDVHGRNFISQYSLSHVQVRDTRLTIIVSLMKHKRHRPHSGSPRIVEHKTRLTFADLERLRLASSFRSYILKIPAKEFLATAPKFI